MSIIPKFKSKEEWMEAAGYVPVNLGDVITGAINKYTGAGLTPAEREANAFTAEREDTRWQREVADMQKAGINPMMAVSSGGQSVSSSVEPSGENLSSLLSSIAGFKQLGIEKSVADADIALKGAQKRNVDADTAKKEAETSETKERERGARLVNDFFADTANIRKVLLGDEHDAYAWKKDVAERDVAVREAAQEMLENNAKHYNEFLDKQKELIEEQKTTEAFKRVELAANAREADASAEYKNAMRQLDVDAQTEQNKILRTEARLKQGIYTSEYIKELGKVANEEAATAAALAQYKRGDYHAASKSMQKAFKQLERDGMAGTFSVNSQYFGYSSNGAASVGTIIK